MAREYDQISRGEHWPAARFVEWLADEAKANMVAGVAAASVQAVQMNDLEPTEATAGTTRRNVPLLILGAVLALGVPMTSATVAALWSGGWIDPDPNGGMVAALQSLGLPGLALAPVGLCLAAWGAGVRSVLAWAVVLLWGLPLMAVLWFVGVAWLGGLAGDPF